ncbi:hypothetical protein [uncultured Umboniibacter sp.]|uniref:pilus assembly protein n=1 Tax=uncultured Umboniibacter sp. TaxID=1798917 RepID=UPI002625F037|nr:hypothetical protein [uncultured Umboniibacter sp.]
MKIKRLSVTISQLTAAVGLAVAGSSAAHDTDIFLAGAGAAGVPNVLFVIDNSANWNASMGDESNGVATRTPTKNMLIHDALFNMVTCLAVPDDGVASGAVTDPNCPADSNDSTYAMNLGLMLYSDSNSPRGGKVMRAVEEFTASQRIEWQDYLVRKEADSKTGSQLAISDLFYLNSSGNDNDYLLDKTNNAPYGMALHEAYRYYMGLSAYSGLEDGNHDTAAVDGSGNYISPVAAGDCGNSYVVLIGNGSPDSGENTSAELALASAGGDTSIIDLDNNKYESSWADEWSRYLANIDTDATQDGNQNVETFVIDVYNPDAKGQDPTTADERGFLESVGQAGYYTAENANELTEAIKDILNEILAINTAFAATALPVSVNVRGTNLNQVYIGVFRPDTYNRPLWPGNLKMYTLGVDPNTNEVQLEDKNGLAAENTASGFINATANSFWSVDSTYWDYDPRGTIPSGSDAPDGEVVEKGGVAQRIRSASAAVRDLVTFTSDTSGTLGTALSAEIDASLYSWLSGNDVYDENDNGSNSDMRPYVHGDVIHSQPAIVNFNSYGNDDTIVVFYGSNDGLFRAAQGGPGNDAGDHRGNELWGLTLPEHLGELAQLKYDASDAAAEEGHVTSSFGKIGADKPYFVDGGIGVYTNDAQVSGESGFGSLGNIGDTVNLYLGMRRGGRFLYALDVNNPDSPRLLWKRSYDDRSVTKDDGFSELGETWSKPIPAVVTNRITDASVTAGYREEEKLLIFFGAGYESAVDDSGVSRNDDNPGYSMGAGIYALDALTGEIVAFIGSNEPADFPASATFIQHNHMKWSIPSDLTIIDRDRNGSADRIYVGDTGGHVWRVNLADLIDGGVSQGVGSTTPWEVSVLGTVGHDQKFLYPPDVVDAVDDPNAANPLQMGYDSVLIGSGDREDPFDTSATYSFYMFEDSDESPSSPGGGSGAIPNQTGDDTSFDGAIFKSDLSDITSTASTVNESMEGWYFDMAAGEKVISNAVTLSGVTYFNTHEPAGAGSCDSLGTARSYAVRISDGNGVSNNDFIPGNDRFEYVPGGGLLPSPVPGIVEIDGNLEQVVISGTHVTTPTATELSRRYRVSRGNLNASD